MIVQEITNNLRHTYSDAGFYIIQEQTDVEYTEAWDVVDSIYTYRESEKKIEGLDHDPTAEEMKEALQILGVDL